MVDAGMASPEVAAPSRGTTHHAKRKASRKSRLTSESLQSLLEGGDGGGADRSGDGGLGKKSRSLYVGKLGSLERDQEMNFMSG